MTAYALLLRAVNVGGTRKVPMARLRALLEDAGYADVRTLLQSGNAVVTTDKAAPDVVTDVQGRLAAEFGFDVPVMARDGAQLAGVIAGSPIGEPADPARFLVTFFGQPAPKEAFARLRPAGEEAFWLAGDHLYAWFPEGVGRSKLAADLGKVGVAGTARNWATVTKLAAMTAPRAV